MKYKLIIVIFCIPFLTLAQDLLDSLRSLTKSEDYKTAYLAYFDLAWEYSHLDADSAEFFCIKALELSEINSDPELINRSKALMATVMDIQGRIEEATALFMEVSSYYSETNNKEQLSRTYNNLGVMFYNLGDLEQAYSYFDKSMVLDTELGDSLGIAGSIVNLASILNSEGKFEEGLKLLRKGKKIADKFPEDEWIRQGIYEGIGNSFSHQKQYDSALIYMNRLLSQHEIHKEIHGTITVLLSLSVINSELGNKNRAKENIIDAEAAAEQLGNFVALTQVYEKGAQLFSKLGDFERAFEYQNKYLMANDSMKQKERIEIINDLEQKYQSEQKEKEIAVLSSNNQKSINQRNILISVSLVLILGAIFLYILWKSKSRSAAIIKRSLDEKETLLKEIHHRVKNNLQIVSSLLSMQSRFIKDKGALEAVNEGQNRVESMALIHQKLYQENNLSGVNALDYIQDLTHVLNTSYGTQHRIEVHFDIDNLNIDIDTIIPIGLILNELISNSFKHAFPDNREGNLYIKLYESEHQLLLYIADDGVGNKDENTDKSSFGLILIQSLSQKLKATVQTTFDNGAQTMVRIDKYKLI